MSTGTHTDGHLLAGPAQSGITVSGGFTGGAITILALIGFAWLVLFMVKKDKLKWSHLIAVVLTVFVFLVSPPGQLAFQGVMTALDGLAAATI